MKFTAISTRISILLDASNLWITLEVSGMQALWNQFLMYGYILRRGLTTGSFAPFVFFAFHGASSLHTLALTKYTLQEGASSVSVYCFVTGQTVCKTFEGGKTRLTQSVRIDRKREWLFKTNNIDISRSKERFSVRDSTPLGVAGRNPL